MSSFVTSTNLLSYDTHFDTKVHLGMSSCGKNMFELIANPIFLFSGFIGFQVSMNTFTLEPKLQLCVTHTPL